ncbi:ATPase [Mycobacterium intermedium]
MGGAFWVCKWTKLCPSCYRRRILGSVTDNSGGSPRPRTGRERIKTLTQAALNVDVRVEQVEALLEGLSTTLEGMNVSLENLDDTMVRFNDTITKIDALAPRMDAVVDRMEATVHRVERIVGLVESVLSPLTATEDALRDAVNIVKKIARR